MKFHYRGGLRFAPSLVRSRHLRAELTDAERFLWSRLRDRQVAGAKFRRQHQFGPYVLDFFCAERRLVIEADGSQHFTPEQNAADQHRTRFLESHGLSVLRFTNTQILTKIDGVLQLVYQAVDRPSP